ncbi:MAG: type IV pilus twitching motility protein PilT, partial [Polyangiaceae bacterium]
MRQPNVTSLYADDTFFRSLLTKAVASKASDVHIKVGQPPGARIRGDIVYFRTEKITPEDAEACARHVITNGDVLANLGALKEYDTSY